jgi:SAM-dependent methyltransferase
MDNQLAYDRGIPDRIEEIGREHRKVVEWVGKDKSVLEMACHTGYVSVWMQRAGCKVTGVELYAPALEKATPFLHRAICGNVESEDTWAEIEKEQYDVVLYMHILEHLVDPETVLARTKKVLKPGGRVIVCLPNVSNWENRWEMFRGDFHYTEVGVMDKTHLRFYNYFTAQDMIQRCGFNIDEYCGNSWPIRFRIFPDKPGLSFVNDYYNRVVHKLTGPNFTDRITMYHCSPK